MSVKAAQLEFCRRGGGFATLDDSPCGQGRTASAEAHGTPSANSSDKSPCRSALARDACVAGIWG
eukprot:7843125-Alexandrium_andersonii.AAC.1